MRVCQQERRRPARAGPRGRQAVRLLDAPHALPCNKRSRRSAAGGGGVKTLTVSATMANRGEFAGVSGEVMVFPSGAAPLKECQRGPVRLDSAAEPHWLHQNSHRGGRHRQSRRGGACPAAPPRGPTWAVRAAARRVRPPRRRSGSRGPIGSRRAAADKPTSRC